MASYTSVGRRKRRRNNDSESEFEEIEQPESDFEEMEKPIQSRKIKSLENCCVNCIVDNMEYFISEYRFGNSIPKKYFEFLQRTYSKNLLTSSNAANLVKHVDFLLNPYLKEIDLTEFRFHKQADFELIVQHLKRIGETIKFLSIHGIRGAMWSEKSLLELTSSLPNVESLSMRWTETTKKVLKNIKEKCPVLRSLDVSVSPYVDDTALKALWMKDESVTTAITSTLVSLDVTDTPVTTNGLVLTLKNFPNLEILRHRDSCRAMYKFHLNDFMKNSLADIKYNLKEVYLFSDGSEFSHNALKMFALICPRVSKLDVFAITSQTEIEACTKFHELKKILFYGSWRNSMTPTVTPFIQSNGRDLVDLSVIRLSISIESVLKCCPKLQTFNLEKTTFELFKDIDNRKTPYVLPCLKKLQFLNSNLGEEMSAKSIDLILSSAPKLGEINFSFSKNLTYDFVRAITKHACMSSIRKIDVCSSDIRFFTAQEILVSTPNLTDFVLRNCGNITKAEYKRLLEVRRDVDIVWSGDEDSDDDDENDY